MDATRPTVRRRGATLRDTLTGVGVLAVLLVVSVLYLTRGGVEAAEAKSLANLRQIGEGFASYTTFSDGRFPFIEAGEDLPLGPSAPAPTQRIGDGGAPVWARETLWFARVPVGDTWSEGAEVARSPGSAPLAFPLDGRPEAWGTSSSVSYRYSNSFVADPDSWPIAGAAPSEPLSADLEAALPGEPGVFRATRVAEVAFPSRKTLLYDADRAYLGADPGPESTRPVLFVDNSAFALRDGEAADPAPCLAPRSSDAWGSRWTWPTGRIHHDTPLGVRGRDY
ncbi:MAG: hypothetical protein ACF8QF_04095 [Phycisphaerales bacterium]